MGGKERLHPADLTLSVQGGDGTFVDQGFVSLVPLFWWRTQRAQVNMVLEMLLAAWSLFCSGRCYAIAVPLGAGPVFCTSWVFKENTG